MAPNTILTTNTAGLAGAVTDRGSNVAGVELPSSVSSFGPPPPLGALMLERQLQVNQQRYEELDAYFRGQHRHSFDSLRFQQAFGRQLSNFADNWLRLVVNTTTNRLVVQGFRVGGEDDNGLSGVDGRAWRIWQANRLAQGSSIGHRDAQKFGTAFVMVDPFDDNGDPVPLPRITVESPYQVIGQRDSRNRYRLISAIKKWIGDDGFAYLNYYLPDVVMKFRSIGRPSSAVPNDPTRILQQQAWEQVAEVENPLGEVPIVPLENQPDLILGGQSDLDDLIPLNDGLNKLLRDMLVASEYQGFRQRWATGVETPRDPNTGQPLTNSQASLNASQSNLWMFPAADAKVGEFGQIDLGPYTSAIEMMIHHIAMVSSTPAYLLVGKMANLSADALRAAEIGFVNKLEAKQQDFGVCWEQAMALALRGVGAVDVDTPVELFWKDAYSNSGSMLANELAIMSKLGLPQDEVLLRYGVSPVQIARWKATGVLQPPDANAAAQISPGPMDRGNSTLPADG